MLPLPARVPSVLGLQPVAWVPWESLTSLHLCSSCSPASWPSALPPAELHGLLHPGRLCHPELSNPHVPLLNQETQTHTLLCWASCLAWDECQRPAPGVEQG